MRSVFTHFVFVGRDSLSKDEVYLSTFDIFIHMGEPLVDMGFTRSISSTF